MEDPLKKLIERRHPEYDEKLPHWCFLEDTYEGGRDWFEENIFRYLKEGDKEFEDRVKRAYRFTHTREVVDLVRKYLYKMPIARREDDASEAVKAFWKKSTLNGLDISSFMRRVSSMSSIYGRPWIVVDNNVLPGQVATRADEKAGRVQVFAYIVPPQMALDFSRDSRGDLNWILLHEVFRDDEDPMTSSGALINRYRLWDRQGWKLFEARKEKGRKLVVTQIDQGLHNLGVVPVFPADHMLTEEEWHAPGLIEDVAYLDRAVANYLSNLDAIIQDQTFSQLAMPAQGIAKGDDGEDKLLEVGTKRLFTYDGEAGQVPFYLSPDVKQAELILKAILKIVNEIYHSVGLAAERTKDDNGGGVDNSSGVAKGYDFERTNSLLTSKGDAMERIENKLVELVCLWTGEPMPKDELVTYPESYDTRGLYDEFEIGARLTLLNAPEGVRREQMKLLIEKLFPSMSHDDKKALESELNKWPPPELMLAGLGAQGSGSNPVKAAGAQKTAKQMAS